MKNRQGRGQKQVVLKLKGTLPDADVIALQGKYVTLAAGHFLVKRVEADISGNPKTDNFTLVVEASDLVITETTPPSE